MEKFIVHTYEGCFHPFWCNMNMELKLCPCKEVLLPLNWKPSLGQVVRRV